jgi:hypothetical protein
LLAITLVTAQPGFCEEASATFRNQDGDFDLSDWLLDRRGFLPVPVIITEPAVGYGAGLFALFFRQSIREAVANAKGRLEPPDIFTV